MSTSDKENKHSNTKSMTAAEDYYKQAILSFTNNDFKYAMKYAKHAIETHPCHAAALNLIGVLYKNKNHIENAIAHFNRAISVNNENSDFRYNLGVVQRLSGQINAALKNQKIANTLSADNPLYLNEIGLLYIELNMLDKAEKALLNAYSINPKDITSCINLSHIYQLMNENDRSITFSNKAIEIDPARSEPYNNIGKALISANYHKSGIDYIKQAYLRRCEAPSKIHQSILMNMLYPNCYTPEEIFSAHKEWAEIHLLKNKKEIKTKYAKKIEKKIRIGFVSPDFNAHSISYFLIPILENINQNEFTVYCYATSKKTDSVTANFKKISHYWRDITNRSAIESSKLIQNDGVNILFDLAGHSLHSSLEIFSHKPAPIQISYLGYPASTGLTSIDYRITDNFTDPESTTAHLHTEKLIKIAPSFLCYKPATTSPIDSLPPIIKNNYITFGSFNNFSKLSITTIKIWSQVLLAVKNAKIILKNPKPISNLLRDNILSLFEEQGILHSRVILHHAFNNTNDHLAYYNNIDICLDPTPYNGTTTTYEALYMGVPVITLEGECHQSRVGLSILSTLELNQLIASSHGDYIKLAKSLSENIEQLKIYRSELRKKLLTSPLTDGVAFTLKFESLLKERWVFFCEKNQ